MLKSAVDWALGEEGGVRFDEAMQSNIWRRFGMECLDQFCLWQHDRKARSLERIKEADGTKKTPSPGLGQKAFFLMGWPVLKTQGGASGHSPSELLPRRPDQHFVDVDVGRLGDGEDDHPLRRDVVSL